ncbi:uncharacterized protein L969DRAFT_91654 [Mixia osmundae IAM 14324]|uniref:Uncharacterized protein n=1 Tax=Mixia osmundae (strain CBS 9802 / IAM 14324 / JCM 22182 / KY 12970) TaxID=764103 RepID=G7E041_MIXOS|nr:uncharacterized protein L969DRAFT_91654 [Mixia osmundae IAM 14324]KEI42193.1 hypothetical protein L969DRAFT_91654 [Mixia osmundae IAM 14324]GAA96201.1 hypothetical protein E5Q_02865 [Mixia osmundae IAM 14324]
MGSYTLFDDIVHAQLELPIDSNGITESPRAETPVHSHGTSMFTIQMMAKPGEELLSAFLPCRYCRMYDHRRPECANAPACDICGETGRATHVFLPAATCGNVAPEVGEACHIKAAEQRQQRQPGGVTRCMSMYCGLLSAKKHLLDTGTAPDHSTVTGETSPYWLAARASAAN